MEIVGVINTSVGSDAPPRFVGLPVVDRLTDIQNAQRVFEGLVDAIPPDRVLTAPMLKVSCKPTVLPHD